MLTHDLYRDPESPSNIAKANQLQQRLSCVIWKSDIAAAFRPLSVPVRVGWTEDVHYWLRGCFVGG